MMAASQSGQGGVVGGSREIIRCLSDIDITLFRIHHPRQSLAGDVPDVGMACVDGVDFGGVYVDADHGETCLGESHSQGQAHIAQADDGYSGAAFFDFRR